MIVHNEPLDCPTVRRPTIWEIPHRDEIFGVHGTRLAGLGLQQLLVVFVQNSVTHMLTGKAIARAVGGHFLADAVLEC